ncbi:Probable hexaprenyl pyrophosphate synthase, mitochondrial [Eumeta japonica]|uniref:Probable hexaprenyl pyrophosphate synthase, mitochondrial n=1 Tax=Eumeta variegata TaxID=151549 RepID=A0A4C1TL44_EUMVA|nr:Probable hexaprenyl pyrophosphate synthase, mitochondrial [Eumeta japonica]
MTFGNKIGLLIGDYLLGHSSAELAGLRNQEVVEIISSAVRDFSESEFIGDRDEQNNPLPSKPGSNPVKSNGTTTTPDIDFDEQDVLTPMSISRAGIPEKSGNVEIFLNAGSLWEKSCQASLKLAGQSEKYAACGISLRNICR